MSNVISSNLLKYKVNKNIDGSLEIPKIFLMSRNLRKRGQIAPIEGLVITPKFTEVNECSFTVYKENNGITLPSNLLKQMLLLMVLSRFMTIVIKSGFHFLI